MTVGRIPVIEGGIQPTIFDAKADLLTATASDTPARLAVGSNDQVLTADSSTATGLKWATPASGSTFVGASVYRASPDQSIANNTFTSVEWTAENYDTDGFHDNVTNNTRLTIPSGKGGYYQIRGQVGLQAVTNEFTLRVQKNGTNLRYMVDRGESNDQTRQINFVASLAAGDYLTLDVLQTSGVSRNLFAGALYCWFECNFLGA